MNKEYRKTVIAGNWKMNKTLSEMREFAAEIKEKLPTTKFCEIVLCIPFVSLQEAVKLFEGTEVAVGAQNMHFEEKGAYTGEVSANMLCELGIKYVIIGHSERRKYFGETDETVNKKVLAALNAGLTPIVCVGETLEQREKDITSEIISMQVKAALMQVPENKMSRVIIAYEPIWAIGTGMTATKEQANEVNALIRSVIEGLYGADCARGVTIQYGGSMNEKNACELLAQPDVDGGLIGGAALKPDSFIEIINAARQ